jgi:2-polyprenyl-3-methyl-5-hydroxy-6-metoxy-1,4-benzoquinol methylase
VTRPAWNHNLHYHRFLIDAMPAHCERTLDVGCGEGTLARKLRRHAAHVTAIDADRATIDLARAHEDDIDYVLGDFLTHPFAPASFDFVVCVAALHHMDPEAAIERMRQLLAPNGVLAVLGLARHRPLDLPRDLAATVVSRAHRLTKRRWHSPAPTIWPPPHTYAEIRCLAERTLPGARYERHLLFRYSILWTKA